LPLPRLCQDKSLLILQMKAQAVAASEAAVEAAVEDCNKKAVAVAEVAFVAAVGDKEKEQQDWKVVDWGLWEERFWGVRRGVADGRM